MRQLHYRSLSGENYRSVSDKSMDWKSKTIKDLMIPYTTRY
jgi:hypothetical protein